ncbi:MAG: T9SS type A sorting domain-containing protein, partial [Candidatus Krumholzibacteriota bacterium]|nr:T9SS type A sorting domain-containing protein [Candidatus Krumholzibacteriota bacterium]
VGDTVAVKLPLANRGNEILTVSQIDFPFANQRVDRPTPFDIPPGEDDSLTLFLEPVEDLDGGGEILIGSNDPLSPLISIAVTSDVRALEINSRLLVPAPEVPLGEALTLIATPYPGVRVERGYLYHRPGNASGSFADSIPLVRSANDFIAIIPGYFVTEAGLNYYVKVENSGIFTTDPPGAPGSFHTQAVEPAANVASIPQPNSGSGFLEDRAVAVEVYLPTGVVFNSGSIHFRKGGETAYREMPFSYQAPYATVTIPDSCAGPRGLEYWIEAITLHGTLTDPPADPGDNPRSIPVTVANLEEDSRSPAEKYRMISIPLYLAAEFTGTLEALLSDQREFGPYDPLQWRAFRYIPDSLDYAELSDEWAHEYFRPAPGKGFWLIAKSPHKINTAPITGYSVSGSNAFNLVLSPGWNQIGNPFYFPVAWDSILVDTFTMAEAESQIIESPVAWSGENGYYYDFELLLPFQGYWVKNISSGEVPLRIPCREATLPGLKGIPPDGTAPVAEEGWLISLEVSSGSAADRRNLLGISPGSSNRWDRSDRSEPPPAPGPSLSLYFPHADWEGLSGPYTVDIRTGFESPPPREPSETPGPEDTGGQAWHFDVAKNFSQDPAGDLVTLKFGGLETVPATVKLGLFDKRLEKLTDLRRDNGYSFFLSRSRRVKREDEARFILIAGSGSFLEETVNRARTPVLRTVLYQNYPNPFNPSTIIRYDIAARGKVTLSVYDIRGALVRVLFEGIRGPGRYEAGWDGTNRRGVPVASGIYFFRLRAGSKSFTRKLVLIR